MYIHSKSNALYELYTLTDRKNSWHFEPGSVKTGHLYKPERDQRAGETANDRSGSLFRSQQALTGGHGLAGIDTRTRRKQPACAGIVVTGVAERRNYQGGSPWGGPAGRNLLWKYPDMRIELRSPIKAWLSTALDTRLFATDNRVRVKAALRVSMEM